MTESDRLRILFQSQAELVAVTGSLRGETPKEILGLLPSYGELDNPTCGILVTNAGRSYALQSGLNYGETQFQSLVFQRGTLSFVAILESTADFIRLEAHVEAQVAAFMHKTGIREATLYINASTPCLLGGEGCHYHLSAMLPAGAELIVYNKDGQAGLYVGTGN